MRTTAEADVRKFGRRIPLLAAAASGLALDLIAPAAAFAQGESCAKVTTESLAIPSLVIDGSKMQAAGDGLAEHCVVEGHLNDRTGVDGKHYAIGFEMRLPVEWNGRFLHQPNGGDRRRRLCLPWAISRRRSLPAASRRWRAGLR